MGCHDQRRPHRLRRFSPLLIAPIATVALRPVVFILRDLAPRGDEKPAASRTLT
jgi:hypothetical protein